MGRGGELLEDGYFPREERDSTKSVSAGAQTPRNPSTPLPPLLTPLWDPGRAVLSGQNPHLCHRHPGVCPGRDCSTRREAFQAEGTFHLTFSSGGRDGVSLLVAFFPVPASARHTVDTTTYLRTSCSQKHQHRSFCSLLPGPVSVPPKSLPPISPRAVQLSSNLQSLGQEPNK